METRLCIAIAFLVSSLNPVFAQDADLRRISAQIESLEQEANDLRSRTSILQLQLKEIQARIDSLTLVLTSAKRKDDGTASSIRAAAKEETSILSERKLSSTVLATISEKQELNIIDGKGFFAKVEFGSGTGWVYTYDLVLLEPYEAFVEQLPPIEGPDARALRIFRENELPRMYESGEYYEERVAKLEEETRSQARRQARIESEKKRKQEFITDLSSQGIPLLLGSLDFSVNSADGVEPTLRFQNISTKEIKYVRVVFAPFNAVKDPVYPRHKDGQTVSIRLVGPIEAAKQISYSWEDDPLFYAGTTDCIEVRRMAVEFMDGSTFTMVNDLAKARYKPDQIKVTGECSR